jgi:hypothetical protein
VADGGVGRTRRSESGIKRRGSTTALSLAIEDPSTPFNSSTTKSSPHQATPSLNSGTSSQEK